MEKFYPQAHVLGRVLLSLVFVLAGLGKVMGDPAGTMQYMESAGVPGFLFWPAALFELLGGLAILIGFQTRHVAFLLSGFCMVTAVMFHADFADQMQMAMFLKNFAMAGGFLVLMVAGPGGFSLDGRKSSE